MNDNIFNETMDDEDEEFILFGYGPNTLYPTPPTAGNDSQQIETQTQIILASIASLLLVSIGIGTFFYIRKRRLRNLNRLVDTEYS